MKMTPGPLRPTPDEFWDLVIYPGLPMPEPQFWFVLGLLVVLVLGVIEGARAFLSLQKSLCLSVSGERP